MERGRLQTVVTYIRHLARPPQAAASDRELVHAFAAQGDEAAFAALVERHAGMVLSICRRILHDHHGAEDAAQATFFVLARKARQVRWRESIAPWLSAVAYRVAQKARGLALRHQESPGHEMDHPAPPSDRESSLTELRAVIDEEVQRLPEKLRGPVVLCYLEGRTYDQAAQVLGWRSSTLKGRLEKARELLRCRLAQRDLVPAVGFSAALLEVQMGPVAVPSQLATSISRIAVLVQAGEATTTGLLSPAVAALMTCPVPGMTLTKAGLFIVLLLLLGASTVGGALLGRPNEVKEPEAQKQVDRQPAALAANQTPANRAPAAVDGALPPGALVRLGSQRFRQQAARFGFLAFSPDGKVLYSGDSGGTVHVWDVGSGRELFHFQTFAGASGQVAISPDLKVVATSDFKGKLGIWDVATGNSLFQMPGQSGSRIGFARDGKTLAATGAMNSSEVSFWDVHTGQLLQKLQLQGNQLSLTSVGFMPDGRMLITKSASGDIRLWDISTGQELHKFPRSNENISPSYAVSPDGRTVTAGHQFDQGLVHWDVASGKQRAKLPWQGFALINGVAYSPDAKTLAVTTHTSLHLLDAVTGKELHKVENLKVRSLYILCFSPDSKILAAAGDDSTIRLWDVASGKEINPQEGHKAAIQEMHFAADGRTLLTEGFSDPLILWDLETARSIQTFKGDSWEVTGFGFSHDGQAIIAGDRLGAIYFWNKADGKEIRRLNLSQDKRPAHERQEWDEIMAIAQSPDGHNLTAWNRHTKEVPGARSAESMQFARWDLATGKELFRKEDQVSRSMPWKLSPDGRLRASYNSAERTRIIDVESDHLRSIPEAVYQGFWPVAFSPDGRLFAGICHVGIEKPLLVSVCEVATGKEWRRFNTPMVGLRCSLAFSADGRMLAAGAQREAGVHIWDLASGEQLGLLHGVDGEVSSISFNRDGKRLASGSMSGTVLLWDVDKFTAKAARPKKDLQPPELESLWTALASDRVDKGLGAVWELVAGQDRSVAYLHERLAPAEPIPSGPFDKLIADLDSPTFTVRESAFKELQKQGTEAESTIRNTLEKKPSADVGRQLQSLLDAPSSLVLPPRRIQELRALEVLERIASSTSIQVIESLAIGTQSARLTQEAKATLARLRAQ